jgi:hypothetical protein
MSTIPVETTPRTSGNPGISSWVNFPDKNPRKFPDAPEKFLKQTLFGKFE